VTGEPGRPGTACSVATIVSQKQDLPVRTFLEIAASGNRAEGGRLDKRSN
jgi:hypothetical protein